MWQCARQLIYQDLKVFNLLLDVGHQYISRWPFGPANDLLNYKKSLAGPLASQIFITGPKGMQEVEYIEILVD